MTAFGAAGQGRSPPAAAPGSRSAQTAPHRPGAGLPAEAASPRGSPPGRLAPFAAVTGPSSTHTAAGQAPRGRGYPRRTPRPQEAARPRPALTSTGVPDTSHPPRSSAAMLRLSEAPRLRAAPRLKRRRGRLGAAEGVPVGSCPGGGRGLRWDGACAGAPERGCHSLPTAVSVSGSSVASR